MGFIFFISMLFLQLTVLSATEMLFFFPFSFGIFELIDFIVSLSQTACHIILTLIAHSTRAHTSGLIFPFCFGTLLVWRAITTAYVSRLWVCLRTVKLTIHVYISG